MNSLSIHLTDKCNNSCMFCVVNSSRESTERVNRQIIYSYLKDNANKGYDAVNIHGGEPTTVPELLEILDKIHEYEYPKVIIQTNARLLKDINFAKELISRGVGLFVVSIHGYNAKQHDYFTGVENSFDEAIQGIKNVLELGKKVRTNTVVCKQNAMNLPRIAKMLLDLGVSHINISALHPTGKAYSNFHLVTPRYSEVIEFVKEAVDSIKNKNITCTLEGFPYCVLGDYDKYLINWSDNHFKLLFRTTILDDYDEFMRNNTKKMPDCCKSCVMVDKCGGIYKEYLQYYGSSEFKPMS